MTPHARLRGTTKIANAQLPSRDMSYRNTKQCAWIDEDGSQCEAMIRKTSTHCSTHAAYIREAQRWEAEIIAPPGMELICPPKMAQKWQDGVRALFRIAWRRYWKRHYRVLVSAWWELTSL